MAEYINGIKVPETIEELNALGVYAKAACEDMCRTLDEIKEWKGEAAEEYYLDLYSDFGCRSIEDAYKAGLTKLLRQAVTEAVNRLTIGKVRGLGLDWVIQCALQDIGKEVGEQFDWWKDNEDTVEGRRESLHELFDAE